MSETKKQFDLMAQVKSDTTLDQLKEVISQLLLPEDEEVLGGKEKAVAKVADSIAYFGAFAPAPATLNYLAFQNTSAFGLPEKEAKRLFEINKRIGALKHEPKPGVRGEERVSVSEKLVMIAKEQWLT